MTSDVFILTLLRAHIALSAGLLLTMALRGPCRRRFGAVLAYRLWLIGPMAAITSLFPTLQEFMHPSLGNSAPVPVDVLTTGLRALTDSTFWQPSAPILLSAWLVGGAALTLAFIIGEVRFRHLARLGLAGPAIVGVASPRLVVPADFATRFTAQEQTFIRRHERAHMLRHDALANLLVAFVQVVGWFNPLVHVASSQFRLDQELACDAQVLEGRRWERRAYGEALMKVQLRTNAPRSRFACAWTPTSRHPLELRLSNLRQIEPGLRRGVCGAVAVAALGVATSIALWSLAPTAGPCLDATASIHVAPARPPN